MVARGLAPDYTPVPTVVGEVAWAAVPVHAIQSMYKSMHRHNAADFAAGSGWCRFWYLRIYDTKFLTNSINC